MLRLYWTHYAPPQIQRILPAPRRQPFRKRCGHLISLPPLVVSDPSGMRATFQHGSHYTYCSGRQRGTGTLIQPKEIKRDSGCHRFCAHPPESQAVLRHSGFTQPHGRDSAWPSNPAGCCGLKVSQPSASYSAFPFTSFSHFPFSLNSAALGLHTPMKCSTKALIQTHFLKWYFSNTNVHTNHWGPG